MKVRCVKDFSGFKERNIYALGNYQEIGTNESNTRKIWEVYLSDKPEGEFRKLLDTDIEENFVYLPIYHIYDREKGKFYKTDEAPELEPLDHWVRIEAYPDVIRFSDYVYLSVKKEFESIKQK